MSCRSKTSRPPSAAWHQSCQQNVFEPGVIEDPAIDTVPEIVPSDRLQIPAGRTNCCYGTGRLRAAANRPDLAVTNINGQTAELSALGMVRPQFPAPMAVTAGIVPTVVWRAKPNAKNGGALTLIRSFVVDSAKPPVVVFRRDSGNNRAGAGHPDSVAESPARAITMRDHLHNSAKPNSSGRRRPSIN